MPSDNERLDAIEQRLARIETVLGQFEQLWAKYGGMLNGPKASGALKLLGRR